MEIMAFAVRLTAHDFAIYMFPKQRKRLCPLEANVQNDHALMIMMVMMMIPEKSARIDSVHDAYTGFTRPTVNELSILESNYSTLSKKNSILSNAEDIFIVESDSSSGNLFST